MQNTTENTATAAGTSAAELEGTRLDVPSEERELAEAEAALRAEILAEHDPEARAQRLAQELGDHSLVWEREG